MMTTPRASTLVAIAKRADDQSTPHHSGAAARAPMRKGYVGCRPFRTCRTRGRRPGRRNNAFYLNRIK